ncbi:MAG TPA: hypothetical protein PLH22_01110 [Candidatus Colwellbacteria bacterium]|nr:hypothetical protein [Candidatus Colwellbacteria bacterium]
MVLLFYGRDSYRRKRKIDEILEAYRDKRGNLGVFKADLEDNIEAFDQSVEFLKNQSLFDPLKIVVFKNFSSSLFKVSKRTKELKELVNLHKDSKDTLIFSAETKPTADPKFFFDEGIKSQEFEELDDDGILKFIKSEALKRGLKLKDDQVFLIKDNFGNDTWSISTELDKLSLSGEKTFLEKRADLPEYYQALNVFKSGRSIGHRLWALESMLSQLKEDPARIFNGLSYGRPPMEQKKWLDLLADYDVAVKSGKLDYEEVLTDLAID